MTEKRFTYEKSEQLSKKILQLEEDLQYYKSKCASLEEGLFKRDREVLRLEKENEQLKKELKEFKDYVFSDEKILCYSCVNCISKGIYEVECSEKGKVDVHGSCFSYWKKELQE